MFREAQKVVMIDLMITGVYKYPQIELDSENWVVVHTDHCCNLTVCRFLNRIWGHGWSQHYMRQNGLLYTTLDNPIPRKTLHKHLCNVFKQLGKRFFLGWNFLFLSNIFIKRHFVLHVIFIQHNGNIVNIELGLLKLEKRFLGLGKWTSLGGTAVYKETPY